VSNEKAKKMKIFFKEAEETQNIRMQNEERITQNEERREVLPSSFFILHFAFSLLHFFHLSSGQRVANRHGSTRCILPQHPSRSRGERQRPLLGSNMGQVRQAVSMGSVLSFFILRSPFFISS
jgi:hypothetical protein